MLYFYNYIKYTEIKKIKSISNFVLHLYLYLEKLTCISSKNKPRASYLTKANHFKV